MDDGRSPSWFVRGIAHACQPADTSPFFCFRPRRVDRGLLFVHEEYLVAIDLSSHVETIPAWLDFYFLV